VVLGVSFHGGSGIVIARLGDGTWSAPSAIGTWGLEFGLQFGLEVAEYIFILQTQESLDHFKRASSFNIGGNVGAAVAGIGREAYGAASVRNTCTRSAEQQQVKEDEYNDEDSNQHLPRDRAAAFGVAPIVAYAKSQGLYVGVSLEGSRIFTRSDVNARAYKFATGRELTLCKRYTVWQSGNSSGS
jgi:lipid-binding SYLF domain-containing protein